MPDIAINQLFEIGTVLSSLKRTEQAAKVMDRVLAHLPTDMQPEQLIQIVRIYGEAGKPEKMAAPLSRYLQLRPGDWQAWLDMATLYAMRQQQQQMQFAIQKALDLGKGAALQRLQENAVLRQAAAPFLQQLMQQGGPVGLPAIGPRRGS